MRRLALLLLAVSVLVTACPNNNDDDDKAAETKTQQELDARVLAPTELGAVYSSVQVAPRSRKGRCGLSSDIEIKDRIATSEVAFLSAETNLQVYEAVSRYERGAAAALLEVVRKLPTECATFTEQQSGTELTMRTAALEFPKLLDDTAALAIKGTFGTQALTFEQIFMRLGDTLVVLVHGGLGTIDSKVTETLARAAAKKVEEGPTASTIPSAPSDTTTTTAGAAAA